MTARSEPSCSRLISLRFAHLADPQRADDVEYVLASLVVVEHWPQDFQRRWQIAIANPANSRPPSRGDR